MQKKKKAILFALCLAMLTPFVSSGISSAEENPAADTSADTAPADNEASGDEGEDELAEVITDEQAAAACEKYAENDSMILYGNEESERIGLYIKATGKYWWSSPINVYADATIADTENGTIMKPGQRKQIASTIGIKVADLRQEKRTESAAPAYSTKAMQNWKPESDGVCITYNYRGEGVKLKVHYELCEDNLYIYADTKDIEEKNISTVDGKILTKLQFTPYFGASTYTDDKGAPVNGYMIIPDGCGAVIRYNNGKSNYPTVYTQQVYGRDYTTVPLNAPKVTQQAYMPVLANVCGNSGLVEIATDGDSNVYAKAQVSGQNKQVYNNCYFEFETRSSDTFYMSGDSTNKINVFEKDGIKTERFGVRYYPVTSKDGGEVNYADCAEVYRNYLIKEKGLKKREQTDSALYLDMYGGVLKRTSVLGIPMHLKTEVTGFQQAGTIVGELKELGADNLKINYNDWTNDSINGKVSTKYKPSGTLGGKGAFEDLRNTDGVEVFPSMNNFTMDHSSLGYWTLTSTAIRVSNAYSRQSEYSLAFGVTQKGVAPALLSPGKYEQTFDEITDSFSDKGVDKAGFGVFSSRLVSDFSRKDPFSRNKTMNMITDEYSKAEQSIGSLIADEANAYVLPYVSNITNVPVYSSGFAMTDEDIPFYQMVLHGYVPYSSTPINKSSDSDETFLLSLASGSQIHYDFTYVENSVLQDTDYNDLYYTNYRGWKNAAAQQYKTADAVLSEVADCTISRYETSEDGSVITVTYSKPDGSDTVVSIDKNNAIATVGTKTVDLKGCLEGRLGE